MIIIDNIRAANEHRDCDFSYAIVRNYKSPRISFVEQMADLSPSRELYEKYIRLKAQGKWDETTFSEVYVPQFLEEMKSQEARARLNTLYRLSKDLNIALYCYCWNERLCHRSIIAGLLQGAGAKVLLPTARDYSQYFRMYQNK